MKLLWGSLLVLGLTSQSFGGDGKSFESDKNGPTIQVVGNVTVGPDQWIELVVKGSKSSLDQIEDPEISFDGQDIGDYAHTGQAQTISEEADGIHVKGKFPKAIYSKNPQLKFYYSYHYEDKSGGYPDRSKVHHVDLSEGFPKYKEAIQSNKWIPVLPPTIESMTVKDVDGQVKISVVAKPYNPRDPIKSMRCYPVAKDDQLGLFHGSRYNDNGYEERADDYQPCKEDGECEYSAPRLGIAEGKYTIGCKVATEWGRTLDKQQEITIKPIKPEDIGFNLKGWNVTCSKGEGVSLNIKADSFDKVSTVSLQGTRSEWGYAILKYVPGARENKGWEGLASRGDDDSDYWRNYRRGGEITKNEMKLPISTGGDVDFFPSHFYLTTKMKTGQTWVVDLAKDKYLYNQLKACSNSLIDETRKAEEETRIADIKSERLRSQELARAQKNTKIDKIVIQKPSIGSQKPESSSKVTQ